MKNKTKPKRHGDVNFHVLKATKDVKGEVIEHNGSFVVELGGATGHKHVLTVADPKNLVIRETSDHKFYFELLSEGELSHEEHKTITIPPGRYIKVREREKDWFSLAVREVRD